ncbi:MAG: hypothetical protein JO210_08235 [Acidobacteriaceae bacterium]|nr:hypothetical protein [Acidobacteriaceae bacterium]
MTAFTFRLQTLLDQKLKLETAARAAVIEKERALQEEQKTLLRLLENEQRIQRQILQARKEPLVTWRTNLAANIQRRNNYLEALQQDLKSAQDEVLVQKFAVQEAETRLNNAHTHAIECSREVEKLNKYRIKLENRFLSEAARKEELEQDEIGTVMYLNRRNGL